MNKNNIIFILSLILIISILPVYGQENNSQLNNSNINETPLTQEDILNEAQRDVDRSLDILNMVSTMITILAALIAIFVAGGAAFGLFEYRKWRKVRKNSEKHMDEIKKYASEAEPIVKWLNETKRNLNSMIEEFKDYSFDQNPSKDMKLRLDELGKKIEFLESMGFSLKSEDYLAQATDLFYKGKFEESLNLLNKAFESDPKNVVFLTNKGLTLFKLKRHEEALQTFKKALKINPKNEHALYNIACTYSVLNEKENALNNLSKVIELDPKYKEMAKEDEDFKNLWDNEDFKKIVE